MLHHNMRYKRHWLDEAPHTASIFHPLFRTFRGCNPALTYHWRLRLLQCSRLENYSRLPRGIREHGSGILQDIDLGFWNETTLN